MCSGGRFIMRLVVGGRYSGKSEFVKSEYGISEIVQANYDTVLSESCVRDFHLFIKEMIKNNDDINKIIDDMYRLNPDVTIISDEVGLGVVPMDKFERMWRDEVGRAYSRIGEISKSVVRVVCGIGCRIK